MGVSETPGGVNLLFAEFWVGSTWCSIMSKTGIVYTW